MRAGSEWAGTVAGSWLVDAAGLETGDWRRGESGESGGIREWWELQ